ncbi:MAG TPA: MFS transporter [Chloroflexota bacterium]
MNGSRNPLPRTFASFRSYNYRLFWFGQLVSQVGTWMQRIGQSWLVLELTHSPDKLGLVTALQFAPILVLSLFAGVWVDRLPKHRVLVVTQTLALVQSLMLAYLTLAGTIQLWQIYVLALLLGAINAVDNPARQAFVMEMVGRENIVNAVALNSAQFNGSRLLGPAIGGLIIAGWSVGICFLVNGISFLAVLVGLLLMRPDQFFNVAPRRREAMTLGDQLRGGLKFVFGRTDLTIVVIVASVTACFGYNFNVVMPLMARNAFNAGADAFGLLMTAIGLGSVVAAFAVATVGKSNLRLLLVGGMCFGGLEIATAASPWFPLAFLVLIGVGYAGLIVTSSANTQLQLSSPDHLRGRVMSVYSLMFTGTTPIGALITGFLADVIHVRLTLAIEASLCVLVPLAALVYITRQPSAVSPQPELATAP